jgi:hypothetical protein
MFYTAKGRVLLCGWLSYGMKINENGWLLRQYGMYSCCFMPFRGVFSAVSFVECLPKAC